MNVLRARPSRLALARRAGALSLLAVATLLLPHAPRARAAGSTVPILGVDELRPGMKAVVRTVFEGKRVEEFGAEIVGVLRGGAAEGDQIIARATGEKAVRSGIAQGMSGSPVYVDGRLVGALSGGWSFVKDPVFVVTPAREMLDILDQPVTRDPAGTGGPSGVEPMRPEALPRFGVFRWPGDDDDADGTDPATEAIAPQGGAGPTLLPLPLACSGLASGATAAARALFEPLGFRITPGGRAAGTGGRAAVDSLVPGSAVAVDLLRGDLRMSAIGTLTWRDGDRVLLFGHPFFQAGEVRLPLSTANIVTVVSNEVASFKVGASGDLIGTVTQDRRTAVAGRLGAAPHLLPLAVTVEHPARPVERYHFESVEDRNLFPQLASVAALNAMLESGGTSGQNTLHWTMRAVRRGAPPLMMGDVIASDTPLGELPNAIGGPLRFLAGNPYQRLDLDSVSVRVVATPGRDAWSLRNARLTTASVRPGGFVHVRAELERWHGETREIALDIGVPEELPDGRYVLWVGGGAELTRIEAQRLPGRYRPVSLDDAWARLGALRRSDNLYAAIVARAPEVTRDGRDYPELPLSAYALMAGGQLAGDDARRGERAFLSETRSALPGLVRGELQIVLVVDSNAP